MKADIVLMASGESRRFGKGNKLLYEFKGKTLFEHAILNALKLQKALPEYIQNIIVVSRFYEIEKICLDCDGVKYVANDEWKEGISASVKLGVLASESENAVLFMVCDQPFMRAESLERLVLGFLGSGKSIGCFLRENGETANPCIFAPVWKDELLKLKGDRGGKSVLKRHMDEVYFCEGVNEVEFEDFDLPPFMYEKGHIVSLVGGGGKTSLMYSMAERYRALGFKTLITTTTHIYKPKKYNLAEREARLFKIWEKGEIAVCGEKAEGGKLKAIDKDKLDRFVTLSDCVIIEADGAKGLPLKAPESFEPVIYGKSDIVIALCGIDALGRAVKDVCFRKERVCELLKTNEEHILSPSDLAEIMTSETGAMKGVGKRRFYVFINKCDDKELKEKGEEVVALIEEKGVTAFCGSLKYDF